MSGEVFKQMEEKMKENPVKEFKWSCGCKILGKPPYVERILLCDVHKLLANQMASYAPNAYKKVLLWQEERPRGKKANNP